KFGIREIDLPGIAVVTAAAGPVDYHFTRREMHPSRRGPMGNTIRRSPWPRWVVGLIAGLGLLALLAAGPGTAQKPAADTDGEYAGGGPGGRIRQDGSAAPQAVLPALPLDEAQDRRTRPGALHVGGAGPQGPQAVAARDRATRGRRDAAEGEAAAHRRRTQT